METWVALLQGHQSRDKILRTACYASILLTGAVKGKAARDLGVFAKSLSSARQVLRFFDDIPMWMSTRTWGGADTDSLSRACAALGSLSMQLFFPFEKLAWASDNEIIPFQSKPFVTGGLICWTIYLVLGLIRNLRQISIMRHKIAKLVQQRKLESPERSGEKDQEFRTNISGFKKKQATEFLTLIKNLCDLTMAVNWLPFPGLLWSGKLSPVRTAFFGVLGSLIGLSFNIKQVKAKKN